MRNAIVDAVMIKAAFKKTISDVTVAKKRKTGRESINLTQGNSGRGDKNEATKVGVNETPKMSNLRTPRNRLRMAEFAMVRERSGT